MDPCTRALLDCAGCIHDFFNMIFLELFLLCHGMSSFDFRAIPSCCCAVVFFCSHCCQSFDSENLHTFELDHNKTNKDEPQRTP